MILVGRTSERGAVAVEFALILPILLLLLLGIMEFGRAYNAQISLTHAAREGVRVMAISRDATAAQSAAINAATSLEPNLMVVKLDPFPPCPAGPASGSTPVVTMTITYKLDTITGIAGPFTLQGKGVMRCGG
jgi:hypothetical protein